jgi:sugar transferase (PEP-CTERM/EpsH1 system associated)
MRILWLNAGLLLPLDKGGKLRTWHLMRHLARRHEITYVSFADPDTMPALREGMREVCAHLQTVPRRDPDKGSVDFYVDAARRIFDPLPYAVGKYRSAAYRAKVDEMLARGFDLVVCDFLVPAVNMPATLPCRSALFTHNVEAEIWRRHAERPPDPVRRALFRQQWRRMLRFERATLQRFDRVLAVSDADRETFHALYPEALRAPVYAVPTGVDTGFFTPRAVPIRPRHLVFTGSMDWIPNEDAMTYFCAEILPRIRAEEPDVTLSIVGRAPTPAVQRLAARHGVEVTGRVEDVRESIADAAVYVVPIRVGGGTRLKIFEAMAMAKAVVATTIGAEGLPVTHGRDVVIADGPAAFADAVVALLRDPERRRRLEAAARQLVVAHYDWAAVAEQFETALTTVERREDDAAARSDAPSRGSLVPSPAPPRG